MYDNFAVFKQKLISSLDKSTSSLLQTRLFHEILTKLSVFINAETVCFIAISLVIRQRLCIPNTYKYTYKSDKIYIYFDYLSARDNYWNLKTF